MTGIQQPRISLDLSDSEPAVNLLTQVRAGLVQACESTRAEPLGLSALPADAQALVLEALGEGTIRIEIDASDAHADAIITETGLTGVWKTQLTGPEGQALETWLETGPSPQGLYRWPFEQAQTRIEQIDPEHIQKQAPDALGAVAVLTELEALLHPPAEPAGHMEKDAEGAATEASHRIDLRMLSDNPAAMDLLEHAVGRGPARILSLGYGRCEIAATRVRPIWRLRQLNATGRLLLDSLEIGMVPSVLLATREDLSDSIARLDATLSTLGG